MMDSASATGVGPDPDAMGDVQPWVPGAGRTWLPVLLLIVVLAAGSFLRLARLGEAEFTADELLQYFSAESLRQGNGPRLPSGRLYTRGLDVTHVVAYSIDLLGPTPFAMRLPAAAFGVLTLFGFAAILWRLGGRWPAVVGTLLMAIHPEAIYQSRHLRFYSYQQVFGLLAFYAGWRALASAGSRAAPARALVVRQWLWAAVAMLSFLLAARAQIVTLSTAAGWFACVALASVADIWARGSRAWRTSFPVQFAALCSIGLFLAVLVKPDLLMEVVADSQDLPYWAAVDPASHLGYYWQLIDRYPLIVSLFPLIFMVVAAHNPRLAVYLGVWFAVPLMLHSFVLRWQGARFVLLAMPALFAATAIATTLGCARLFQWGTSVLSGHGATERLARGVAAAAVAVVAVAAIITTPAFHTARKTLIITPPRAWEQMAAIVRSNPDFRNVPLGHSQATLAPIYYWGRLDFEVSRLGPRQVRPAFAWARDSVPHFPEGTLSSYSGAPVLTTPDAIRGHFQSVGSVLIGLLLPASALFLDSTLVSTLEAEAEELCQGRCGDMRLYHWRFGAGP